MSIRLNIGCGADLRKDYVNVDMHSVEDIEKRYGSKVPEGVIIVHYDIFNLPYEDGTVEEVMCLGFLEHLSFEDEGKFFKEVKRVLRPGGIFHFTVPDFENLCKQFLDAEDNFIDFYQLRTDEHWFGNGDRNIKNRWGYLINSFFGNQNGGIGQFHKNAYTVGKIKNIMEKIDFCYEITNFNFKNTEIKMIECKSHKK